MADTSLATKYRPQRFSDVVEQDVIKTTLGNQIKKRNFKNCLLFCGGAGTGKAQPLYSKVLTPNGFITMGEVVVGTEVITGEGRVAKVIETFPQGMLAVYRITLTSTVIGLPLHDVEPTVNHINYTFEVADNHLNVIRVDDKNEVVSTLELIDMFNSNTNIYMYTLESFADINTKIKMQISKIEYIGVCECQCIYVDAPEHTYVTDNYVITHNTTNARIFANEINNFQGRTIEIDAASHNGVDDARRLIEDSKTQSLDSEYKTFLIDECHMMSVQAWNALLKLLEEPPKKSIFLFCTTDPQKIPPAVLSRLQKYDFQRISLNGIINRLKYIIESENAEGVNETITFEDSALEYIAKRADGGMRDAITLLENAIGYNSNLTLNNVLSALGSAKYDTMFDLTDALNIMDKKKVIEIIEAVHYEGIDLKQFMKQYSVFVLELCKYDLLRSFEFIQMPTTYLDRISKYSNDDFAFINQLLGEILSLNNAIKYETVPKPLIESTLLLLCMEA